MKRKSFQDLGRSIVVGVLGFIGIVYIILASVIGRAIDKTADNDSAVLTTVFGCLGGALLLAAALVLFFSAAGRRKDAALRENGTPVKGRITDFSVNRNISVNGRCPFALTCESDEMPGVVFKKNQVWEDLTEDVGKEITIYVDPANPKRYYIDIAGMSTAPIDVLKGMREADAQAQRQRSDR